MNKKETFHNRAITLIVLFFFLFSTGMSHAELSSSTEVSSNLITSASTPEEVNQSANFNTRVDQLNNVSAIQQAISMNTTTPVTGLAESSPRDLISKLITLGYFTQNQYDQFVELMPFETAYSALTKDRDVFISTSIRLGLFSSVVTDSATLKLKLKEKGIDIDALKLTGDGILTAAALSSEKGFSSLLAKNSDGRTMTAEEAKAKLNTVFLNNKNMFIENLKTSDFLDFLGATNSSEIAAITPIFVNTWAKVSEANPSTNFIVNPVVVIPTNSDVEISSLDMLVDVPGAVTNGPGLMPQMISRYTGKQKTVAEIAAEINKLPAGQRDVMLHSYIYLFLDNENLIPDSGGAGKYAPLLDALKDANGNIIRASDGTAYLFPSLDKWAQRTAARVNTFLSELKEAGANVDYFIFDYEDVQNSWWYTGISQFFGDFYDPNFYGPGRGGWKTANFNSVLLQDPRMQVIMADLNLSPDDIKQMAGWGWNSEKQLKWDAYMARKTKEALNKAFIEPIKKYFVDAKISNYSDNVSANTIANGWASNADSASLGMINFSDGRLPSDGIYGRYMNSRWGTPIAFDVPAPNGFLPTATAYFTAYNSVLSNIAQVDATDLATDLNKRHWVTTPSWAKGMLGPQTYDSEGNPKITYNSTAALYEGGEDLGNRMAEIWYRVAASSDMMNFWNGSSFDYTTPADVAFAQKTMKEINELMGFGDKRVIDDAWVELNGKPQAVGPQKANALNDIAVWGVHANNENLYRVVLDLPAGALRESSIINDGTNGEPVEIKCGNSILRIKNSKIIHPANEVSLMGFWVVQENKPNILLTVDKETIEEALSVPMPVRAYFERMQAELPGYEIALTPSSDINYPYTLIIKKSSATEGSLERMTVSLSPAGKPKITSAVFKNIDSGKVKFEDMLTAAKEISSKNPEVSDQSVIMAGLKINQVDSDGALHIGFKDKSYYAVKIKEVLYLTNDFQKSILAYILFLKSKLPRPYLILPFNTTPSGNPSIYIFRTDWEVLSAGQFMFGLFEIDTHLNLHLSTVIYQNKNTSVDSKLLEKGLRMIDPEEDFAVLLTHYELVSIDSDKAIHLKATDSEDRWKILYNNQNEIRVFSEITLPKPVEEYIKKLQMSISSDYDVYALKNDSTDYPYRIYIQALENTGTGTLALLGAEIDSNANLKTPISIFFGTNMSRVVMDDFVQGLKQIAGVDAHVLEILSKIKITEIEKDQTIHLTYNFKDWAIAKINSTIVAFQDVSRDVRDYIKAFKTKLPAGTFIFAFQSTDKPIVVIYRPDNGDLVKGDFISAVYSLEASGAQKLFVVNFKNQTMNLVIQNNLIEAAKKLAPGIDPMLTISTKIDILRINSDDSFVVAYNNKAWKVKSSESGIIVQELLLGDANEDGVVNALDYIIWASQVGQFAPNLKADFNFDGTVDKFDYNIWAANFRTSDPVSSVATISTNTSSIGLFRLPVANSLLIKYDPKKNRFRYKDEPL